MSQIPNTNLYMNRRCEPMGSELDSSNKKAPNVIPSVASLTNFPDPTPEENFIDDLTLKVRSLLKSWEDDFPNDDQLQDDAFSSLTTLNTESQVSSDNNFNCNKFVAECRISNDLQHHHNDSKWNPNGSMSKMSSNERKNPDLSLVTQQVEERTLSSSESNVKEISKGFPLQTEILLKSQNRSEFKGNNKGLNNSKLAINKKPNSDLNESLQSLKNSSTPIQTVEDPQSYDDFSCSLQDIGNIPNANQKNSFPSDIFKQPVLELSTKAYFTETNSTSVTKNFKSDSLLNAFASTDLYSRESSDKETERSWSEITIVAESFSESCRNPSLLPAENQNDFSKANLSQPASIAKSSKLVNSNARITENKNVSSPDIFNKETKVNIQDKRIIITDHDKQDSDREYQFSDFLSTSNLSDFDRDTPPLSASSMASSKRLEWDNGADIGYNVAAMRSKVIYRSIPRSEPEGISFINETGTNVISSQIVMPSFASASSQDEPTSIVSSHLDGLSSEASSVHDPSLMEDLLERSSSPGSLSRSDSKKSVIYNSFKSTLAVDKISSSSDPSLMHMQKNFSWPDLTIKNSVPAFDWPVSPSKLLSKSDEHVNSMGHSNRKPQQSHFPNFIAATDKINKSSDSSHLPERILPVGEYFPSDLQSAPKQNSVVNMSVSCRNCQPPLNGKFDSSVTSLTNQMSGDLHNLQEGDLGSYEIDSGTPDVNQTNDSSQFSHHGAGSNWSNESVFESDVNYIAELPELSDYQLHSFNSRPFLLLSHDSLRVKGSNFPNIVQNLFHINNAGDHSANGNFEVKPHIRWYPFPSNSNLQDIKNVSTQTSVSFTAKQQTDSLVQASDKQISHRDESSETLGSSLRCDSSATYLDKISSEILYSNNFHSTSPIPKASIVTEKGTLKSQINLNERTNSSLSHTAVTSVPTSCKSTDNSVNQVDDKLHWSKRSNSLVRNLPCAEHKCEVEKHRKMPFLSYPSNSVVTSHSSTQYQPSVASNDIRYDSDDSAYLHTKNIISQTPSKYIFSGDIPSSITKRRVGVGQCQTSPPSVSSKVTRENFKIHPDMNLKETKNSTTENLTESTEKDESVHHSSEDDFDNCSSTVFSRFISYQFDNQAAGYGHSQSNFKQNLDDTIPLTTAFNQNDIESAPYKHNASSDLSLETIILSPYEKEKGSLTDLERRLTDEPSHINNHFMQTDMNSSQLLSDKSSFSLFKQHQNRIIQKSHSDPLILRQNCNDNTNYNEDETLLYSQLPPVNRKLDFESSKDFDIVSCKKNDYGEKSLIKHSNIEDNSLLHNLQQSVDQKQLREASNSVFYKRGMFNNKGQLLGLDNIAHCSNFPAEISKSTSDSRKSFLKDLISRNAMKKPESIQRSVEYSDVVDDMHQISAENVLSTLKYFDVTQRNYASIGIQVSPSIYESDKCIFCNKNKDSHMNCCFKKEVFKNVLNNTLAKRISEMKSKYSTSFCVFSSGCYCCCNKTLQEAFNFHRSEVVERIELRKKEAVEKCKKKLFLRAPPASQTKPKQSVVKSNLKSVDVHGKSISNKENRKIKKSESLSWKSTSSQKGRQRNLNKYNRIMSKIYSQRLKNETLKGKVNHQRHEILISS